jgi:cytochrome c553
MLLIVIVACTRESQNKQNTITQITSDSTSMVTRGEYLVSVCGCNDCHSPKKMTANGPIPDLAFLMSGHPAGLALDKFDAETATKWLLFTFSGTATKGPWGVSFAANISPDVTGIGTWTEAQFISALKYGNYRGVEGARKLLPPMPWTNYSKMTDDDAKAIFAYLKTLKPVKNIVPEPIAP